MDGQELEVKYYIQDKERVRYALQDAGAELIKPRIHEVNLKFDTKDHSLSNKDRILRLRQDTKVYLTYKGPGENADRVFARQEIELTVDDFQTACTMLNALGYQELMTYEKYRTVYAHQAILVTVDELPIGDFVEIEAPSAEEIFFMSDLLGLDWEKRWPLVLRQHRHRLKLKRGRPSDYVTHKRAAFWRNCTGGRGELANHR